MNTIQIKKINNLATIPNKGSEYSAGYDLYSIENYILMPMDRRLFKIGISINIPPGQYGRIAPRSGLAYKDGIDVLGGVIDEDYRGEIGVILINFGKTEKQIKVGDKIAQIIFEFYNKVKFELVDELQSTQRGAGGFGSTDIPPVPEGPKNVVITEGEKPPKTETINLVDRWFKKSINAAPIINYEMVIKEAEKSRT